ncbi:DUF5947 family protein [Couchioplanes caeruleus]|uniref:Uncharacterized protein n=2 Tax=Couchioplanes caeruleus TaxID=56438 RepID=A0A1K0FE55_9ACTN|nr:DUF5947 family protein [Couchioplanes caeruleus]OJF11105.1 hypothetical protein BG844_28615 [Couchioplanes caeruleus subsp. caeruleus]ROP33737.1 hypothetical protein EDD30_6773 [Couchioplanes caeruleus]
MVTPDPAVTPLTALRRIARSSPSPAESERCDFCAAGIESAHPHVVDLQSRALLCACRPCHLLFTDERANLRYRAVPQRHLSLPGSAVGDDVWDALQIPVGLVFLFRSSVQNRMVACYPGPAGATESELPLPAWDRMVAHTPRLGLLRPDVEALLVRRVRGADTTCHLVPIDACYELVGRLRTGWRGFDGGREAHDAMDRFFARLQALSRPAPPVGAP